MASFDHFVQILLIQILLILVFFAVAFYVFKKADMAKRNNFMYFPWMEKLFLWIFPFCVSLFIVVIASVAEKEKISEWLKARVGTKKLRLITE